MPKTLDKTYERILLNIDEEYQPFAIAGLNWLAFSNRPLSVSELAEAAVIHPGSSVPFDPEERLSNPGNDILEILGSLVSISSASDGIPDDSSISSDDTFEYSDDTSNNASNDASEDSSNSKLRGKKISLAHFSVKEYLISGRLQDSPVSVFGINNLVANQLIAKSCLFYIFHYDKAHLEFPWI